ncbi:MAG TPA: response regulator [Vicinamibacterales bacterium]|nr:response regulator [Vicinamibacterales bacterium]
MTVQRTASAAHGPGTILNVNDHEAQRYVVSKILRNAGYRVIEAATGVEAVDVARAEAPDVVVLDIQLPDINGMEVCRRLKHDARSASPFVLHTSATFASTEIRVAGLDVGGDAFLAQPFTAQELVATVRALVRRKHVEEDQRRRAEAFAEADRRKDDFLAMLGHELRNPLNALTMSQAIIEQYPAQSPAEQHARAVARRQTAHLTRLVNDLLEVSRVTRGKITLSRTPLDLGDVLRETAGVIRSTTIDARSQKLVLSLPDYPIPIDGDRVRLGQIFANLLENASKYSPDHSQIDVELVIAPGDGRAVAVVTIIDHGRGIAEEQLGHVFNLFYQAQPSEARIGTGLGIGLTLVRALAELHGGAVTVRSAGLGKGSEFEVRLPTRAELVVTRAHHMRQAVSERRRQAREGQTVLIVEDNADARVLLEALCRSWGYDVAIASNGLIGVEKAVTLRPYLSFVDIGLPGIDGYEVARRLRAAPETQALTLVALTGYGLPAQREKALAAGFDVHLVKPVDPELLARLLDEPTKMIGLLRDRRRSLQPPDVERRAQPPI